VNARTRGYQLPSWVDFESLAIARKGIESSWETRANAVSVVPVEVDVIAASPKPTYCKAACEGRQYQVITCADCKTSVHAEGSRQTLCKPCGKKRKLIYQAKWKAKLSPEKREAARGRRKRTVTSFGGAESASASNGSSASEAPPPAPRK
jgi:hypothetical protein